MGRRVGTQERVPSELVSEPQQGLVHPLAKASLLTRLPAKLCKHSSAVGRAGDTEGTDERLLLRPGRGRVCPASCALPSLRTAGPEGFLGHPCGSRLHFPFAKTCPIFILLLLTTPGGLPFSCLASETVSPRQQRKPDRFRGAAHVCGKT